MMASNSVKLVTNKSNAMKINIDCQINNTIITPLTCSSFIMELIKLLVYEKFQIPYPYSWLKSTVNRRKKTEQTNTEKNTKVANIDRCYKLALTALEFLDNLSTQLHKEFKNSSICEILLCFGVNTATPTETYNIVLPNMLNGHADANHLSEMNKTVHKIMRKIILSDEWLNVTKTSIPPTNMHVLIKKNNNGSLENEKNDYFLPKDQYRIPTYTRLVNINLKCLSTVEHKCCSNLEIFQDKSVNLDKSVNITDVEQEVPENNSTELPQWFQAKYFLKGFLGISSDDNDNSESRPGRTTVFNLQTIRRTYGGINSLLSTQQRILNGETFPRIDLTTNSLDNNNSPDNKKSSKSRNSSDSKKSSNSNSSCSSIYIELLDSDCDDASVRNGSTNSYSSLISVSIDELSLDSDSGDEPVRNMNSEMKNSNHSDSDSDVIYREPTPPPLITISDSE